MHVNTVHADSYCDRSVMPERCGADNRERPHEASRCDMALDCADGMSNKDVSRNLYTQVVQPNPDRRAFHAEVSEPSTRTLR